MPPLALTHQVARAAAKRAAAPLCCCPAAPLPTVKARQTREPLAYSAAMHCAAALTTAAMRPTSRNCVALMPSAINVSKCDFTQK